MQAFAAARSVSRLAVAAARSFDTVSLSHEWIAPDESVVSDMAPPTIGGYTSDESSKTSSALASTHRALASAALECLLLIQRANGLGYCHESLTRYRLTTEV